MNRNFRTILLGTLTIAIGLALIFPETLFAGDKKGKPVTLTFSYHGTPQATMTKAIFEGWANDIEKASDGQVKIVRYPGGTLVKAEDAYDAVATGLCDIAEIDPETNPGRFPLAAINNLPFLYPDTETAGVVSHQLMNKYCTNTELREIQLMVMSPLHEAQYLGNKKVESLSDLKGLRIRSAGHIEAETIKSFGAIPVEIGTGELASALDKKMVDGCFFCLSGGFSFGLKDVTTYRTIASTLTRVFFIGMNKATFNNLPEDIKKVFVENSTVEASRRYAIAHMKMGDEASKALARFDQKVGNPPFTVLSEEERSQWKEACRGVWDEWVNDVTAKGLPGKAMLEEAIALIDIEKSRKNQEKAE